MNAYRFRTEFDQAPYYPILHQALDTFFTTYCDPARGLLYHTPIIDSNSFPTQEEIRAEIPNSQGWYTAIEDCSFLGPLLLGAIGRGPCGLSSTRRRQIGTLLFWGLVELWAVPGSGFVARGLCPGGRDYYPNSSPDQVPNYLRGLWTWATCELATPEERAKASEIFHSVLTRLESFDWDLRRADGKIALNGSCNIGYLSPRSTAQFLAMFVMAADLTGQSHWTDHFRRFRDEDGQARLALIAHDDAPTWLPWQMELVMEALRVLERLDPEPLPQAAYRTGIRRMGAIASVYVAGYGLWGTASRVPAPPVQLSQPPAPDSRPDFRAGYQKSIELDVDLSVRRGQVMQGRIIEGLYLENPSRALQDGRTPLVDHLWALSVIGQSGMPWSNDGVRVQGDTKENWILVAKDILAKSAPEVPWGWGTIALANFFSAWERREEDPPAGHLKLSLLRH